jgi:uncharacterized protein YchJ
MQTHEVSLELQASYASAYDHTGLDTAPADVMAWVTEQDTKRGAYQPCPCGSGRKFRFCHGDKTPNSLFTGVDRETAAP